MDVGSTLFPGDEEKKKKREKVKKGESTTPETGKRKVRVGSVGGPKGHR